MRRSSDLVFALSCCIATALAGSGGAQAEQQSYLYPPEVHARPVVVVPHGGLQRHYWDPRCAGLYVLAPRHWRRLPAGLAGSGDTR